jgi:hypothetical protein
MTKSKSEEILARTVKMGKKKCYPSGGGYIVYVRLSMSVSLTAYTIPP